MQEASTRAGSEQGTASRVSSREMMTDEARIDVMLVVALPRPPPSFA